MYHHSGQELQPEAHSKIPPIWSWIREFSLSCSRTLNKWNHTVYIPFVCIFCHIISLCYIPDNFFSTSSLLIFFWWVQTAIKLAHWVFHFDNYVIWFFFKSSLISTSIFKFILYLFKYNKYSHLVTGIW